MLSEGGSLLQLSNNEKQKRNKKNSLAEYGIRDFLILKYNSFNNKSNINNLIKHSIEIVVRGMMKNNLQWVGTDCLSCKAEIFLILPALLSNIYEIIITVIASECGFFGFGFCSITR
jgi:hypothetical protein